MDNPESALEPLFHGMPVLVRLTNREDILCVLFHRREDEEHRLFMERPLHILTDEIPVEHSPTSGGHTKTIYSAVRTRFARWIPFTTALIFPIYSDHVLSIAPLADEYINSYMEWADQLYAPESSTSTQQQAAALSEDTLNDIRRSYVDYLLQNFNHKGKPH